MVFHRLRESKTFKRVTAWTKRHERLWIPLMLVGGLSADVIQFSALNIEEKFAIMGLYLVVSTGTLLLMFYPKAGETRGLRSLRLASPFAHQFAVGGLLSTSLLFYWFSGDISVSWPIILLVVVFMLSNEFFRKHFLRPTAQVGVLMFSLFSLTAVLFSFVFNSLDPLVFFSAGLASLVFMAVFTMAFARVGQLAHRRKLMFSTILVVFGLMNAAYFLNIIPPIPLSIRSAGVYHTVVRNGQTYDLSGEPETWWQKLLPGQTIHVRPTESLYAYSAIFAPADLSTTIVHEWQYYDASTKDWKTAAVLSFSISGGRDDGYRGYSKKSHLTPGKWRVNVKTTRGQVLGRIPFTVVTQEVL